MPDVLGRISSLLKLIIVGILILGIALVLGGIWLVYLGATGETEFTFFGQTFKSINVGIAAFFLGAASVVLILRRTLKTIERGMGHDEGTRQSEHYFDLLEQWKDVNEIDCDRLIGPDVTRAANAMRATATSWLEGLVSKRIIVQDFFQDYSNLYEELTSCDKVVPGYEKKGSKCQDFISAEIRRVYKEMKQYKSGR